MTSTDVNNILNLIAATIFADKHVYDSEIEAFVKTTSKLNLGQDLSETQLSNWYEANKSNIRQKLASPFFKDWFYELLDQLSEIPDKASIINVMREVSKADGEVHISERALITLAERHWGMR